MKSKGAATRFGGFLGLVTLVLFLIMLIEGFTAIMGWSCFTFVVSLQILYFRATKMEDKAEFYEDQVNHLLDEVDELKRRDEN